MFSLNFIKPKNKNKIFLFKKRRNTLFLLIFINLKYYLFENKEKWFEFSVHFRMISFTPWKNPNFCYYFLNFTSAWVAQLSCGNQTGHAFGKKTCSVVFF